LTKNHVPEYQHSIMENLQYAPSANNFAYFGDSSNADAFQASQEKSELFMGWGGCKVCSCDGYVSDMQHDGHCVCGHTAADHK
jgi:hypothetical protein